MLQGAGRCSVTTPRVQRSVPLSGTGAPMPPDPSARPEPRRAQTVSAIESARPPLNPAPARRLAVVPSQPSQPAQPATSPSPPRQRRYPDLSECVEDGPSSPKCTHTECRYHLAHRGYWEHSHEPTRDCAIDVANEGPHTLDEVAAVLGVSGERVRQVEEQAFEQLRDNPTLKAWL